MKRVNTLDHLLRWLGHSGLPGARRVIDVLSMSHAEPRIFDVAFFGLRFVGSVTDAVDRSVFYYGAYSPGELEFIDRAIYALARERERIAVFDVGANSGQHSLFASRRHAVSVVHAFEPSQAVADRLSANVRRNGLEKIVVHQIALGDQNGAGQLGSGFPGNTGSRSLNWTLPGAPTETISVRAAGEYFAEQKLPRIDFLKLDVEGHEKKVVTSLADRLISDRPIIMMELIGKDEKGGFASEGELRAALYPRHRMRSLIETKRGHALVDFDWERECVVIIPKELDIA